MMRIRCDQRRGLSLVEAVVSTLIVGVMFVAVVATVGSARGMEYRTSERARGLLLAEGLLAEILQQAYADPDYGTDSFGLNATEAATGDRSLFDDVDDYDGWDASPPQFKDGSEIPDLVGWRRKVEVAWLDRDDIGTRILSNEGVKFVEVQVLRNDRLVISLTGIRADAARDAGEILDLRGALSDLVVTITTLRAKESQ